MVTLMFIKVK